MLDKEPFSFPARRFVYDPAIPDRQLWAIGMIAVQWSLTEYWIEMSIQNLIKDDDTLKSQFNEVRGFQQTIAFWQKQLELRAPEPLKSAALALIPIIKNLSDQRDQVVHRMWGGGMEGTSPAAAGLPTTEAGMLPHVDEGFKTKRKEGLIPFKWKADFARLRQLAHEIANVNRDLISSTMLAGPPHGYVDSGDQVAT